MSSLPNVVVMPRDHAALEVGLAVFANVTETVPTKQGPVRWGDAVESIVEPKEMRKQKADLPLFKLARFNGSRKNESVAAISGVIIEHDAGTMTFEQARDLIRAAGIEAVVYSTPSSTAEHPRWRIVVPFSKEHEPDLHAHFVGVLNAVLDGALSPESWTLSQIYYVGRIEGTDYRAEHIAGDLLDERDECELVPKPLGKPGALVADKMPAPVDDPFTMMERDAALAGVTADTMSDLNGAVDFLATHTDRASEYTSWIETGEALASLKGTPFEGDALELWRALSATDPRYDEQQAQEKWNGFRPTRITYKSIFAWATDAGWVNPRSAAATENYNDRIDWTDAGNANLLRKLTSGDLRYVVERDAWMQWTGTGWELDTHGKHAQRQALRVSEYYLKKAAEIEGVDPGDDGERKRFAKRAAALREWAATCRNSARVKSMLDFLSKSEGISISQDQLDCDTTLLGAPNGVIDLRTGKLRPVAREDFVTKRTADAYNENATAPTFEKFIADCTAEPIPPEFDADGNVIAGTVGRAKPRPHLARYIQCVFGYFATGLTREHKMFFIFGPGANGKNVLVDAAANALRDYAATISVDALMASHYASDGDKATPTMARLVGVRLASCSETRRGQKLDAKVVKGHTGDMKHAARQLHGHGFEFVGTHKLLMLGNHRPAFDHDESAMHGRIHLIELKRQWNRPEDVKRDPALPDGDKDLLNRILRDEGPGVLAWIVRGAVAYLRDGLGLPDEVRQSTLAYIAEQGRVAQWLAGWEVCDPRHGTKASDLFGDYQRTSGDKTTSQIAFGKELVALGIAKTTLESGTAYGLHKPAGGLQ